ncbi:MFS transporter [Algihabitans albus]|uniref:MFS transporter n=1 Tax=Algihabitans albus TaxID=2164067 RepID=UPI000E5D750E|nr:MFS transporter [Algihabitans albus]
MPIAIPLRLTVLTCAALVLAMLGNATFPALIPLFQDSWDLSASQAGWVSGVYYAGYAAAVPVLVGRTDRIDARRIFIAANLLGAVTTLGFALFANSFWTALPWRFLAGAALAGSYMVGARILADRIEGPQQSRAIAWYTAHFAVGVGLSVLAAGELASRFGWQSAFFFAAAGSVAAALIVWLGSEARPPQGSGGPATAMRWVSALKNRAAMGYTLGYTCHIWELFGWRAWLVAFLVTAPALGGLAQAEATRLATVALIIGLPASVLGNELSIRFGRRRVLTVVMASSAVCTLAFGLTADGPSWLLLALLFVVGVMVMGDSGSLTAGAVGASDPEHRGALMAIHTLFGFGAGFVAPLAVGIVLDAAGGMEEPRAWAWAFALLAFGAALGPWALRLGHTTRSL